MCVYQSFPILVQPIVEAVVVVTLAVPSDDDTAVHQFSVPSILALRPTQRCVCFPVSTGRLLVYHCTAHRGLREFPLTTHHSIPLCHHFGHHCHSHRFQHLFCHRPAATARDLQLRKAQPPSFTSPGGQSFHLPFQHFLISENPFSQKETVVCIDFAMAKGSNESIEILCQ